LPFMPLRLSSVGRLKPLVPRRTDYVAVVVGGAGDRRGVPHAPAPGALADPGYPRGLCAADGHFQQRPRLAADPAVDRAGTEDRPGGIAAVAAQGIHRPGVRMVP